MTRVGVGCLAIALSFGSGAVLAADTAPYEAIRSLQNLQDLIATGDAIAQAAHAKAMERTARAFSNAKTATWKDKRNARALILYLFSGGNAPFIEQAIPPSAIPSEYQALYGGAIAYGCGDDDRARTLLMPIDAKTFPSGLGGHLALVQATLTARDDQPKAVALLDLARLLEPGTLIEDAALRKEMSLIGATGDLEKFAFLARRYLTAFSRSAYAENFRQLAAQTAMQLGAGDGEQAGKKLGRLLASLEVGERKRLYLAVARTALIAGRTTMAAVASQEAGRLAEPAGADEARAMTYFGAAAIVGPRYDLGMKALSSVAPERLDAKDRALRASAIAVAEMIRAPLADAKDMPNGPRAEVLADAERSLTAADTMLASMSK